MWRHDRDLDRAIAFYEALGLHLDHRSELTKNKATLAFMAKPAGDFAIELVYNWGSTTTTTAASASATSRLT